MKKRFSLDEFETKRRKTCAGRCLMNTCYICCTLCVFMMFAGYFADMYVMYKKEISKETNAIETCKDDFKHNFCD